MMASPYRIPQCGQDQLRTVSPLFHSPSLSVAVCAQLPQNWSCHSFGFVRQVILVLLACVLGFRLPLPLPTFFSFWLALLVAPCRVFLMFDLLSSSSPAKVPSPWLFYRPPVRCPQSTDSVVATLVPVWFALGVSGPFFFVLFAATPLLVAFASSSTLVFQEVFILLIVTPALCSSSTIVQSSCYLCLLVPTLSCQPCIRKLRHVSCFLAFLF